MAGEVVDRLEPGMVLLADRGFCGFPLWSKGRGDRRGSVVAGDAEHEAPPCRDSCRWVVAGRAATVGQRRAHGGAVDDPGRSTTSSTTAAPTTPRTGCSPRSLDPAEASAEELAVAYAQRWEIEAVFDELKVHQRGARTVLRSKSPELVLQEIWGHLCCHYAIRTLMWEAAGHAQVDPDRVSFVAALRIARRSISAARDFPPQTTDHGWRHAISSLPAQPDDVPTTPCQTQIRQVARQTSPPRRLAPTHRSTHRDHPPRLTERYCG